MIGRQSMLGVVLAGLAATPWGWLPPPARAEASAPAPPSPAVAATTEPAAAAAPNGAALYRAHCASCHGAAGRGDGPDAELYDPPPRDLRTGWLDRYDTAALVDRIRAGRPLEVALDLDALRARARETEAIAAHLVRLPVVDWRRVEIGQEVYLDRCEICHGPFGRPADTLPPGTRTPRDLASPAVQRALDDRELAVVVRHGREGMPALTPRIPETDAAALVAFVRLLSPGFELYTRYCAACHGDDGRGGGSLAEALPQPTVVFDAAYFAHRDPEELRGAIWHMLRDHKLAMPHLRSALDEVEARAIVGYLRDVD